MKLKIMETNRLLLRGWKESDREPFFHMNNDSHVIEFLPKPLSKEESDLFIDKMKDSIKNYGFGFWAVEEKSSGDFIGFVGLIKVSFNAHFTPCVEIGWRL